MTWLRALTSLRLRLMPTPKLGHVVHLLIMAMLLALPVVLTSPWPIRDPLRRGRNISISAPTYVFRLKAPCHALARSTTTLLCTSRMQLADAYVLTWPCTARWGW